MAKRHPSSSRRPDRERTSEPDDIFVAKVYEASTWAQQNRLTLIVFGIILAAMLLFIWSYVDSRQRMVRQAVLQLEQIQQTTNSGDTETAKAELEQYLDRFGGTPHAGEARLILARLYLSSGQPAEAVRVLEASDISPREPMGLQILVMEAKAHEAAGDFERAEALYLSVADRAELAFQVRQALGDAARLRERTGDYAGAVELYERILDEVEATDPAVGEYRMRLSEARLRARG